MKIIPASEHDLELVRQIALQTWPEAYGNIISGEQMDFMLDWMYSPESLRDQLLNQGHRFLLAGELGFASFEHHVKGRRATKIHKLYVLPQAQGLGVGKALVEAVDGFARTAGDTELVLNVNRFNKALHFYLRLGFAIAGEEDIDIGRGFWMQDYIMRRGTMDERL